MPKKIEVKNAASHSIKSMFPPWQHKFELAAHAQSTLLIRNENISATQQKAESRSSKPAKWRTERT